LFRFKDSRDGEEWIEGPSWDRGRKNHFGTIRVVADEGGQFFATMVNLKGFNNSLVKLELAGNYSARN
jgi:hypothetical protein